MITSRDIRFYEMAEKVARLSDCASKHGAIVVRSGNVLSVACNRKTSHPVVSRHKPLATSIHAEHRCLVLAQSNVSHATLYSARVNGERKGKPCRMCHSLMIDAGITSMVYFNGIELVKERI